MNLNENDLNTEDDMKLNVAARCNSSIDKQSITQVEEMNGSSPGVQTVGGFKGWAFLRKLLNEQGAIKFRIGNRDKYPISVFQIKATQNRLKQEKILQTPKQAKAIELQVRSYRSSQALDSYIYSYTWASKEYGQVAAVAYDNFQEKYLILIAWPGCCTCGMSTPIYIIPRYQTSGVGWRPWNIPIGNVWVNTVVMLI
jgi:hypothetical protein